MIGCLLFGALGAFVVARMIRHHQYAWAYRGMGCGGGGHGLGGGPWFLRRMHHMHHRHHHGPFGGPFGGHHPDHLFDEDDLGDLDARDGRGGGFRRNFILSAVLNQVQATPVQERAIRAAFDEMRTETLRAVDGEGKRTRQELGGMLRKPSFDEVMMGELYARHDRSLESARKSFVGFMAKIHDTLDEEQRARLAALVEKGPRAWGRGFGW